MTPIDRLREIMHALRTPDTGCPWDLEQDFSTIAPYTIEEAYEVADAIERKSFDELRDELGDLLFQVVFHSQMAAEQNLFDFDDVATAISDKMVTRHPHVFGDASHRNAEEQTIAWEEQKALERASKQAETNQSSALSGVARTLPSMIRSQKLQKRAARVGFDWPDTESVMEKVDEELQEVRDALKAGDQTNLAEELGDLMFVLVNLCRKSGLEAEETLKQANLKFEKRFSLMEALAAKNGEAFEDLDLERQETYWLQAKSHKD